MAASDRSGAAISLFRGRAGIARAFLGHGRRLFIEPLRIDTFRTDGIRRFQC